MKTMPQSLTIQARRPRRRTDGRLDRAAAVAERWLGRRRFPRDYTTDLVIESLLHLGGLAGWEKYRREAWAVWNERGHHPADRIPFEHEPFTNLAFELCRDSGDQRFVAPFLAESRRCRDLTRRSPSGLIVHPPADAAGMILIDAVQAYAARMARAGWLSGEQTWFDDTIEQLVAVAESLVDPQTGLWRHGRHADGTINPFAWSRAQGWALRGLAESLEYMPADHPGRTPLLIILRQSLDTLVDFQTGDGAWRLLVDDKHTPRETSGTAMIVRVMTRARRRHWITADDRLETARDRAVDWLATVVSSDGVVGHGCPGTGVVDTRQNWRAMSLEQDEPHTVAAVIDALIETYLAHKETERDG